MKRLLAILPLSALLFASCMHLGMMGTHGDHQSMSSGEMKTEPELEKEVVAGGIKATATFPPLQWDTEVVIQLKLVDAGTMEPITGAKVVFHAQRLANSDMQTNHDHSGAAAVQTSEDDTTGGMIEQVFKESREAGFYSVPYGAKQPGEYKLIVHVAEIPGRNAGAGIVIEAKRMLPPKMNDHSGGMMGMGGGTATIVVGTMLMGAMMVVMLAAQGRIF